MSARGWCYTLNNYTEEDIKARETWETKYHVYGKEIGDSGTEHLQGYVEFAGQKRLTYLKKLDSRAHWEVRRGTADQAAEYCKKDGNFYESGTIGGQGKRKDIDNIRIIAMNDGMRGVTLHGTYEQIKVAKEFLVYHEEPRDWLTEVYWLFGPTGTGKSRTAREICTGDVYTKSEGSKWWDGYDGHEEVIIDDFRDSWWKITDMLRLLDRYECRVEIKGGMRQFKPKKIVVTSIFPPEVCYRNTGEAIEQLLRRITKCIDVSKLGEVILDSPEDSIFEKNDE